MVKRLGGVLALVLVVLLGCSLVKGSSRVASAEQQRVIVDEFWSLFPGTVEATGTDPSHFVYAGGAIYTAERIAERGLDYRSCSNDVDGTSLYMLSASVSDSSQRNTKDEYQQKVQGMRDLWESQGYEVRGRGPHSDGSEIVMYTDSGTRVSYLATVSGERISVDTACVLSK
ncbi:hypothetical protein [Rothia sp. P5766]|uniref:hypothetical protein n=1 Tax=Rothia sp. P5766 TaxID=3402656 RepID=UPI003ADF69DF